MRVVVFFILILVSISCATSKQKNNKSVSKFAQLDSLENTKKSIDFSIKINEEKWLSYTKVKPITGELYYYIKNEDENFNPNFSKASIRIYSNKINKFNEKPVNVEDYLERFVNLKKKWSFKDFKYNLVELNHNIYGKSYVVKYKDIKKYIYNNAVFLFLYKKSGYTIEYSALEEHFDRYLPEVENIVNSFKINED